MNAHLKFKRSMAGVLILAMLHLCWLSSFAWAEIVTTDAVLQTEMQTNRDRLRGFLNREALQEKFEQSGISQMEVLARIDSLTEEEVIVLVTEIDQLPEGGSDGRKVLSGLGRIFIILITGGIYLFLILLAHPHDHDC